VSGDTPPDGSDLRRLEYQTCSQRARTSAHALARSNGEKAAGWPPFPSLDLNASLAGVHQAVLAPKPGAGDADKAVAAGIVFAADRTGGDGSRRADRAADDAGCDIAGPAAIFVPAVVTVLPRAIPIGLIPVDLTLIAAGIGISRSLVLAVGVWIKLRAIAGIVDDFLRHRGAGERGGEDRRGGKDSGFCHMGTPWMMPG